MELLCIQTHSAKLVIAGNIYPFISDKSPCKCPCYDVGIRLNTVEYRGGDICKIGDKYYCGECGKTCTWTGIFWVHKSLFGEISEQTEESTYEKKEELIEKL